MTTPELHTQFATALQENMPEQAGCKLDVSVEEGCDVFLDNYSFQFMATELINNCAEKDAPDVCVTVVIAKEDSKDTFRMTIEDSVQYEPNEVDRILKILQSPRTAVRVGKKAARASEGGLGVINCRRILSHWGGSLEYHGTQDGRIVAVATWSKSAFLAWRAQSYEERT